MHLGLEPKPIEVIGCLSIDFDWLRLKPSRQQTETKQQEEVKKKKKICMFLSERADVPSFFLLSQVEMGRERGQRALKLCVVLLPHYTVLYFIYLFI